jgi:excisionase family DNA binding protein
MSEVLTVVEIGKRLKVSRATAYQLVAQPDFPKIRLGRAIRVPAEAFERWMEEQAKGGGAE